MSGGYFRSDDDAAGSDEEAGGLMEVSNTIFRVARRKNGRRPYEGATKRTRQSIKCVTVCMHVTPLPDWQERVAKPGVPPSSKLKELWCLTWLFSSMANALAAQPRVSVMNERRWDSSHGDHDVVSCSLHKYTKWHLKARNKSFLGCHG